MKNINLQGFVNRLSATDKDTQKCIEFLMSSGHFKEIRKATKEEDLAGVDWWVNGDNPIQFKLRYRFADCPIVLRQPFYGTGDERSTEGRDIRGLMNKVSEFYYVGIVKNQEIVGIYRCSCEELRKNAKSIVKKWSETDHQEETPDYGLNYFTPKITKKWLRDFRDCCVYRENDCEIWWKKNFNENFGKFNLYIPKDKLKSAEVLK